MKPSDYEYYRLRDAEALMDDGYTVLISEGDRWDPIETATPRGGLQPGSPTEPNIRVHYRNGAVAYRNSYDAILAIKPFAPYNLTAARIRNYSP